MKNQEEVSGRSGVSFNSATNAWVRSVEHVLNSMVEANRATRAALGLLPPSNTRSGTRSLSYRMPDWYSNIETETPDTVSVGDVATFTKTIAEDDVHSFAAVSGDTNRLHLDESFAEGSRFGGPIVHGTLVSGLISAALARFPGVTIYLSQDVRFLGPVRVGEELTATCEVIEDLGDGRFRISTQVHNQENDLIIDGEAHVLMDEFPE